jgi:phytoene dehydrogenase-like protein
MNLSLFAGSPFFAAHRQRLLAAGLKFVSAPRSFATAFPDGSWLGVEGNVEATAERIVTVSQADAARWRAMAAAFAQEAPHFFALLAAPLPSWEALRAIWRAWRARGSAWVGEAGRLLVASPRDWLDENFESEKLKAMMGAWALHLDFSPDVAGGALFAYLAKFCY